MCSPRILLLGLVLAGLHTPVAIGELDFDPKPPMRWDELLSCEQVILAR